MWQTKYVNGMNGMAPPNIGKNLIHFKHNLEDDLSVRVDVIEIPLTEKAQKRLIIRKTVPVYERA